MEPAETALDRVRRDLDALLPKSSNTSTITINAGGVGVWVAAMACIVMLTALMVGAFWVSREFTRIDAALLKREDDADRAQTYLSAIYARMPELRAQLDKENQQEKDRADSR